MSGEAHFLVCRWLAYSILAWQSPERASKLSCLLIEALIPFMRVLPSWPNHLPEVLRSAAISLRATWDFHIWIWEGTHIQSITNITAQDPHWLSRGQKSWIHFVPQWMVFTWALSQDFCFSGCKVGFALCEGPHRSGLRRQALMQTRHSWILLPKESRSEQSSFILQC
jgi:hypothetical protein